MERSGATGAPRRLRDHPAMQWSMLGKVVEAIEIGPWDEVVLIFEDGSRLRLTQVSTTAEFLPYEACTGAPTTP